MEFSQSREADHIGNLPDNVEIFPRLRKKESRKDPITFGEIKSGYYARIFFYLENLDTVRWETSTANTERLHELESFKKPLRTRRGTVPRHVRDTH
ncbi:unnamed protein product [Lasius platythorax]|uniref:Uncharacterized protein n=1 Tax=Lasius platythorax TaxID=488582 RepID=A0AAV2P3J5_9HYME